MLKNNLKITIKSPHVSIDNAVCERRIRTDVDKVETGFSLRSEGGVRSTHRTSTSRSAHRLELPSVALRHLTRCRIVDRRSAAGVQRTLTDRPRRSRAKSTSAHIPVTERERHGRTEASAMADPATGAVTAPITIKIRQQEPAGEHSLTVAGDVRAPDR
jgi:hypothetical protein